MTDGSKNWYIVHTYSGFENKVKECCVLTQSVLSECDFSREIQLTEEMALGDTLMLMDGDSVRGFALCHSVPLV